MPHWQTRMQTATTYTDQGPPLSADGSIHAIVNRSDHQSYINLARTVQLELQGAGAVASGSVCHATCKHLHAAELT